MDTLLKHNKETEDKIDERWHNWKEDPEFWKKDIIDFITSQNTELLKKIAKGEIERLKNSMELVSNVVYLSNPPQYPWNNNQEIVDGYNKAINDQLTRWQQVLEDLEK